MYFKDRKHAGSMLASLLFVYQGKAIVYAFPRGGVVAGAEVAQRLSAPLELVISQKIGHPYNAEYAIAAVTEQGDVVKVEAEVAHVDRVWFQRALDDARQGAESRRNMYGKGNAPRAAIGAVAIIVDDGIATGLTMKAAIVAVKRYKPIKIIVAVPVAPLKL